jgi:hypothetical protein
MLEDEGTLMIQNIKSNTASHVRRLDRISTAVRTSGLVYDVLIHVC